MNRLRFVSPGSLSRLLSQAAESWKRQDYQQTLEILERAVRLDPGNTSILLDLGRAYGLRYAYRDAERCFEKAVRLASQKPETLVEAGRRCQEFGNCDLAKGYFERATADERTSPEGLVALAEIHERYADLPKAIQIVEHALELAPANPGAQLARARLERLAGALPEAERRVRRAIAEAPEPWMRARLGYELGQVLDRMACYDEAMEAFLAAKAVLRPAARNHAATLTGIQRRVREMEESMEPNVFARWASAVGELQPLRRLTILCGHPRSGTTLLEQVLDAHPAILTAEETHILHDEAYLPLCRGFDANASILQVLDSAPASVLRQSRENYFRCVEAFLNQNLGERTLVDKNPALNVLIPAVTRIFPEAKFLVALRDPRDVCLSCFMQPLAPNPVSSAYLSLEDTVSQYLSVMGFWLTLRTRLRNPFLEVRYEEVVKALAGTAQSALSFLEVPWNDSVLHFHEHARGKLVRSPSYAEVTKPVTVQAIGRWQNYRRYLEPHLARLEPLSRALGYA